MVACTYEEFDFFLLNKETFPVNKTVLFLLPFKRK
jgi:hypothetical protein